jgi:hypothetical protein
LTGIVLLALAPLAITGGVTVVRAMRSLNEALVVVVVPAGFAVVVAGFAMPVVAGVPGFAAMTGADLTAGVALRGAVTVIA